MKKNEWTIDNLKTTALTTKSRVRVVFSVYSSKLEGIGCHQPYTTEEREV